MMKTTPAHPLLASLLTLLCIASATGPTLAQEENVRPGINDNFLNPGLNLEEWLGRFEIESREVYGGRHEILRACRIRPGSDVADIGAGTGFFTRLFADATGPGGWVYAVDIAAPFLQHINKQAEADGVPNITAVLGARRTINLPPDSIDFAFTCDTYHHFEYPATTLISIHRALRPGGTLVVIDFERIPGESSDFIMNHVRAGKDVFRSEIESVGFEFVEEVPLDVLEENYFLRFRKLVRQ